MSKDSINFRSSAWALVKVLRKVKFTWKKSVNNRKMFIEIHEIREKRLNYLQNIKRYREEGRPVI